MLVATRLSGFGAGTEAAPGGGGFSPADVTLTGWWDPSDLSTLWKDTAGTDPVTADGDLVARIDDKSGNVRHWTQSTSTNRPTYKTSGGLHWLDFDGNDNFMTNGNASNFFSVSAFEAIVAARFDTIATNNPASYENDVVMSDIGGYTSTGYAKSSGIVGAGIYTTTDVKIELSYSASNDFVISSRKAGASSYASLNGGTESSTASGNIGSLGSATRLGVSYLSDYMDGRFYGAVTKNSALTTDERNNLITWLGAKAGLSL